VNWYYDEDEGIHFLGDFDVVDHGTSDVGLPFCVTYNDYSHKLFIYLIGDYSVSGATLEMYQGERIVVDVPGPDIENMQGGAAAHYGAITDMLGKVLQWFGDCISAFFVGSLSSLVPVFALAIAIPLVFFAIKFIRQFLR
jgi:hypothetical protein